MIRITKLTDYALIILNELSINQTISAREISNITRVPYATTNKILKLLTPEICNAKGGKHGGYYLAYPPEQISLLKILQVMEGNNLSITECSHGVDCSLNNFCKTKDKLNLINKEINSILSKRTLADLK